MNPLELNLRIVGFTLILLCFLHLPIAKHLDWKTDAARLTPVNRQIFHVHAFFICLILLMLGILCLAYPRTLLDRTPLARLVLIGLTTFWALRLFFQWFVYDRSHWRGHRFNTTVHLLFTLLWTYYTLVFSLALRLQ